MSGQGQVKEKIVTFHLIGYCDGTNNSCLFKLCQHTFQGMREDSV